MLAEFALRFFDERHRESVEISRPSGPISPVLQEQERDRHRALVLPLQRITIVQGMQTSIGLIHALRPLSEVPFHWLSTHPPENCLGLLRRLLRDCDWLPDIVAGAAKNVIVEEVKEGLGISGRCQER